LQSGGIHRDGVGTTNLASGLDLSRPLSAEVSKAIELVLQDGYDHFISVVAEGRSLPREKVEELAQGKVYSGSSAREIGLVDKLGSLEQTIEAAAERAGLVDYQVTTLLPPLSWQDRILHKLGAESRSLAAKISILQPFFKSAAPALSTVQKFLLSPDPNGIYAHCMINYSL
jgi:protease-4